MVAEATTPGVQRLQRFAMFFAIFESAGGKRSVLIQT
jgi:hypothetical protein